MAGVFRLLRANDLIWLRIIYWIIHNFVRSHFTTRKVPAAALGIIDKGLSPEQLLMVQKAA